MTEEKKQAAQEASTEDIKKSKKQDKKKKPDLKEQCAEFEHKYKLAFADYQNLLKRTAEEKQEFAKFANEQFIMEILPVYDNLKVSMEHIDEAAKTSGWAEGIKYVIKQFADVLKNMGVEEIEAEGKKFDHNTMEAIEGQGEKVKKVVKAGYKMKDKVISHAKVILE